MLCHLALISLNHRLWEVIFNIENKGLEPEEKRKLTHQLGNSKEFKVYKMSGQWTVEEEIYIHDQQICDKCQASLAISKFKLQWEWEGFPGGPVVKNSLCNARVTGWISGPGRFHMPWGNWARARARDLQKEKPWQREAHRPQLEKACVQQQRPTIVKQINKSLKIMTLRNHRIDHLKCWWGQREMWLVSTNLSLAFNFSYDCCKVPCYYYFWFFVCILIKLC